ncbi:PAS domain S-box protein [Natrialba sp. INN-245]|uniref:PAS domain S-box protein n=1 Tax=Natrialba sp. INN-245 TaxID=2690967 RepID=UPI00130FB883|nr:PAS domain S-box protein [Natrialba sp. INN-245]MWV40307.1 PAS domain S-box protein [Natrialba sp. INN-245]
MSDSVQVLYVDERSAAANAVLSFFDREIERITVDFEEDVTVCDRALDGEEYDCIVVGDAPLERSRSGFLEAFRNADADLPCIILTTDCAPNLIRSAVAAGITEHLPRETDQKSFPLLVDRIDEVVARYRTNRRADEYERINSVLRKLNQTLVRASSRTDIDQQVCEIISQSEPYRFAWIGEHDPDEAVVTKRAAAGIERNYLDAITITTDENATARGPTGKAVRSHETQVMQNIPADPDYEPWRDHALERGYRSSAAIPLVYEGDLYGVLNVYADRIDAFDADERALFDELGETIAYALHEREIREERHRLERAVEHAADAIFITDTDGAIEYVNPAFENITGYTSSEAIGQNPRILQSGEVDDEYYAALWETILAGEDWEEEIVNATKSGEHYHAEQTIAPVADESGEINWFVAIQRNVTERKRRERELEEHRTRLQVLFDQAPDGIVVHDVTGAVLDVNETLAEMLGYSRAELLEMDVSDFETEADDEPLRERWATMAPGSSHKAEVDGRHRRADGSTYPVEVWVSRLDSEDGDDRFVAFVRDITDRNQRIRQLRVLDRVLRHNLNNEMSIIRGYAQTIEERTGGELADHARQITAGSDQLLETVAKQREIVQILSKPPEYLEVDIVEITQQILDSIRAEYPDARIGYEGPDRGLVEATTKIELAIEELVTNALAHSNRSTPAVTVEIECTAETVTLRIADNGPGIPEEERCVLTGTGKVDPLYHGSGLGLWLVYWILERSSGAVEYETGKSGGSVIELTLNRSTSD